MMHIKDILKDFNKYAEARKNFTLRTKLAFIFVQLQLLWYYSSVIELLIMQ